MNIVLLSGGSGKRLWPLSNNIRSKQFIKIFKNDNGEYESMLQRVYNQIKSVDAYAKITIATSKNQVSAIRNQLGYNVEVVIMTFVAANGLVNLISPTCGAIMGGLALAKVDYSTWFKWAFKVVAVIALANIVILTVASLIM